MYEDNSLTRFPWQAMVTIVLSHECDATSAEFYALFGLGFGDYHGPIKCQSKTAELSVQSKALSYFDGLPVAIT